MKSLRFRLTLGAVAVVGVSLAILSALLYLGVRRELATAFDRDLAGRARAVAALVDHDEEGYEFEPAEDVERASLIQVWRPDGSVLYRSAALLRDLPRSEGLGSEPRFEDLTLPDGRRGRMVGLRFRARSDQPIRDDAAVTLVLAEDVAPLEATLAAARPWFWGLGAAALPLVALLAAIAVARALRPLGALSREIEGVDAESLGTRFATDGLPAELSGLVRRLNDLLERLEASFERERRFTADASHELRTPLAGLRSILEVTARRPREQAEYVEAVGEATRIVVQMQALVENLLYLARLDAGQVATSRDPVALRDLVEESWHPHAGRARKRRLAFENLVSSQEVVITDREKLRVIAGNLLANAAEYTAQGGRVRVSGGANGSVLLDVSDSGPPIPEQQLGQLFDPFFRGQAARADSGVHCGVGLALARSLCACLGMSITAENLADQTVRFRIERR